MAIHDAVLDGVIIAPERVSLRDWEPAGYAVLRIDPAVAVVADASVRRTSAAQHVGAHAQPQQSADNVGVAF